jgi:Glycosyl hydrolase family 63 C-terminal domain
MALVGSDRLPRILARLADPGEFLSPHGLRALSAVYRDHPYEFEGHTVDYEPAESTTSLYGGNSNWRGPIWFPVNHLVIGALQRFHRSMGSDVTVTIDGRELNLDEFTKELVQRMVALYLPDGDGARPVYGGPGWADALLFHEYFDGDTGRGLGASHQTGWTGLVANMVIDLSARRA